MLQLNTIRYMGNKSKLLEYIVPAIQKVTPENGVVCDLMSGSNVVSYALKEYFTVYTNDVQEYSKVISDAVIVNQTDCISAQKAIQEIKPIYDDNREHKYYTYFADVYSGTYFSAKQCEDIDSIRYAVENIKPIGKKSLYLFALMNSMCIVQSTPGHFAQFMPSNHRRIIPLQQMNLWEEFLKKCDLYSNIYFSESSNKSFCMDYKDLMKSDEMKAVDTVYLDSPYSQEQYSRFYHILETVVKYDYPEVKFKAKYRNDRFMSKFCYKKSVVNEFTNIFEYCSKESKNLVISYSNRGVLPLEQLINTARKYFPNVEMTQVEYKHSTQGKGVKNLSEVILSCTC